MNGNIRPHEQSVDVLNQIGMVTTSGKMLEIEDEMETETQTVTIKTDTILVAYLDKSMFGDVEIIDVDSNQENREKAELRAEELNRGNPEKPWKVLTHTKYSEYTYKD